MPIDLYHTPASAACRVVRMVAAELDIPLNLILLNLMEKEQLKPEFVAINPQHCVPTIVDHENGVTLWESRAIITYLVNQYSPGHSLYPSDPKTRAYVDRLLYFDASSLYPAIGGVVYPPFLQGKPAEEDKFEALRVKLAQLDKYLEGGKKYLVGDSLTLADLNIFSSLTMLDIVDVTTAAEFENVTKWITGLLDLPYNKEINEDSIKLAKDFLKAKHA